MNDPHPEAIAVLKDARDRIADPAKWHQGRLFLYAKGDDGVTGDEVLAMCAMGAFHEAVGEDDVQQFGVCHMAFQALRQAACSLIDPDPVRNVVAQLNDTTDHETVMLMFKMAINDLEHQRLEPAATLEDG